MPDDAATTNATEQLDALYQPPHRFTVAKDIGWIDPHGRR